MNSAQIGGGEKRQQHEIHVQEPKKKEWNSIFDAMENLRAQTLQRNRAQKV